MERRAFLGRLGAATVPVTAGCAVGTGSRSYRETVEKLRRAQRRVESRMRELRSLDNHFFFGTVNRYEYGLHRFEEMPYREASRLASGRMDRAALPRLFEDRKAIYPAFLVYGDLSLTVVELVESAGSGPGLGHRAAASLREAYGDLFADAPRGFDGLSRVERDYEVTVDVRTVEVDADLEPLMAGVTADAAEPERTERLYDLNERLGVDRTSIPVYVTGRSLAGTLTGFAHRPTLTAVVQARDEPTYPDVVVMESAHVAGRMPHTYDDEGALSYSEAADGDHRFGPRGHLLFDRLLAGRVTRDPIDGPGDRVAVGFAPGRVDADAARREAVDHVRSYLADVVAFPEIADWRASLDEVPPPESLSTAPETVERFRFDAEYDGRPLGFDLYVDGLVRATRVRTDEQADGTPRPTTRRPR